MYRQLTAPSLLAVAIAAAMMAGCASGRPAAAHPAAGSAASSAAAGPARAGRNAFCALAHAKGAADLVTIKDQSAAGGGRRQILARLDALTSAAPPGIRPDFTRLDHLEHTLLGGGPPDPHTLGQVEDPHTITSLQHIERYLAGCGISG
jgi:hypothetical protein